MRLSDPNNDKASLIHRRNSVVAFNWLHLAASATWNRTCSGCGENVLISYLIQQKSEVFDGPGIPVTR